MAAKKTTTTKAKTTRAKGRSTFSFEGLTVAYNKNFQDDWELFELFVDFQENEYLIVEVLRQIFGSDYEKIKEHYRKDGAIKVEDMLRFFSAFNAHVAKNL